MFKQSTNNRSKTIYLSLNNSVTIVRQSFKIFQQSFQKRSTFM